MVDVWNYVNSKKVKITDIDGEIFVGDVVCVMDSEENGTNEDDITIQINKETIIGFSQSEIESIEDMK